MSQRPILKRSSPNSSDLQTSQFNIRSPSCFVALGHCRCWKCSAQIEVWVLGVAPPFSYLREEKWRSGSSLVLLSYVEKLAAPISHQLIQLAPRFFCDESRWNRHPYWMNHCPHCDAKVGDYETIDCAGATFNVQMIEPHRIQMSVVSGDFQAAGILNTPRFLGSKTARSDPEPADDR